MAKPIKPLSEQIEEYKSDYRFTREIDTWDYVNKCKTIRYQWVWDEKWDGQLIKDVQALEAAGFTIVSFSRKRKVTLKLPETLKIVNPISKNAHIVNMIDMSGVSHNYYSISFKPTLSIYWKGRSSSWRY